MVRERTNFPGSFDRIAQAAFVDELDKIGASVLDVEIKPTSKTVGPGKALKSQSYAAPAKVAPPAVNVSGGGSPPPPVCT